MYNLNNINPAYTIDNEYQTNLGLFYRNQWINIKGAPETFSFFGHHCLNEKMEFGLNVEQDKIGESTTTETNINVDYSYRVNLSNDIKLSFGIKSGVNLFRNDFSDFNLESGDNQSDPLFAQNNKSSFFTLGSGVFLNSERFYFGVSVPNIFKSKHLNNINGVNTKSVEELHFYASGGYVLELNDFKLKPSFLYKRTLNSPYSIDISLNMLYNNKFELGCSYRLDDSFSVLSSFNIYKGLNIGYAYDRTITNLGNFNSGTHELFLIYKIGLPYKNYKSPRFF